MPITDLIPWKRREHVSQEDDRALRIEERPLPTFQQEMNRLFDDFFGASGLEPFGLSRGEWDEFSPRVDAVETDSDIRVSVELPGIEEKDIDVTLTRDSLTIAGEKRQEKEEKGRSYFRSERSYGSFRRSVPLPCEVDANKVDAVFRKGVLTITLPKMVKAEARRRISIRRH
jgi:HSP20 family protein